jgi:hypothetical protein
MASTSGRRVVVPLTNKSGGSVAAGDVVIIDTANDDAFTTTTVAAFTGIVGIAQATIANNGVGPVLIHGEAALINVSASVTRGHFGATHTVAKQAASVGASRVIGAFVQFKTGGTTPKGIVFNPDLGSGSGTTSNYVCQGRLTLTTALPVTTADVSGATTLYFTPYAGNQIATYSGAAWTLSTFTEKSLSLAGLTADSNYDIFIVDGTLALEALIWTNATTRATALVLQDGVLVKSGATTRRYLGTIRINASGGQCEDTLLKRYVWNYYNRKERPLQVFDSTDSWSYAVATTWRQARATAGNKVEYVCGFSEDLVAARVQAGMTTGTANQSGTVGIGVDATATNSAQTFTEMYNSATNNGTSIQHAQYRGFPGIGYHYLAWLEYTRGGSMTFNGDNGVAGMQSGLLAEVLA